MSNAILDLIAREQVKLQRQLKNVETIKVEIDVLGATAARQGKLDRADAAIKETKANIAKLNKASG